MDWHDNGLRKSFTPTHISSMSKYGTVSSSSLNYQNKANELRVITKMFTFAKDKSCSELLITKMV